MKRYLSHLASAILGTGALVAGPAHAAITPGGITANHYYFKNSFVSTDAANADGMVGYTVYEAPLRITHEPGNGADMYYASQFFWTINRNTGGYIGIQQDNTTIKKALISIWNQTYNKNYDTPGPAATTSCQGFGGEGTGTQCLWSTTSTTTPLWKEGIEYILRVEYVGSGTVASTDPDYVAASSGSYGGHNWSTAAGEIYYWKGSIIDTSTGTATVLGTIHVPASFGLLQGVAPQFTEDYGSVSSCTATPGSTSVWYQPSIWDMGGNLAPFTSATTEDDIDRPTNSPSCASTPIVSSTVINTDHTIVTTIDQAFGSPFEASNLAQGFCADTGGGNSLDLNTCINSSSSAGAIANQQLATDTSNHLNLSLQNECLQANGISAVSAVACVPGGSSLLSSASSSLPSNQQWLYMPGSRTWLNVGPNSIVNSYDGPGTPGTYLDSPQCLSAASPGGINDSVNVLACNQITQGTASNLQQWPTKTAQAESVTVPLGGNAYITQSKNKPDETIDDSGLHNWDSSSTTISTYVDVLRPGDLQISLIGGLFGSTQSTVKVSIGNQSQTVSLAPAGVANSVFPAGTFWIAQPGYVKIDLQGISNNGGYFGDISALQLDGSAATGGLLFADDPSNFYWSRRGPSVHLGFTVPPDTEYFYSEVSVPVGQDPVGTYYMANGFNVGYFGMQVNAPNKRWILFSVWDPSNGSTTLVAKGNQTLVDNFGGEGTGGQSHMICNWVAGSTYRFITRAQPDGQGNTLFSAWFGTPQGDNACGDNGQGGNKIQTGVKWNFLATWKYPGTAMYHQGVYSFLEGFNPDTGYLGRRGNFGNEWAISSAGVWTEITSAWYDVDPTGYNNQRADFAGGAIDNQFYLRNDGFFTPSVANHQWFYRQPNGTHPDVDLSSLPQQ